MSGVFNVRFRSVFRQRLAEWATSVAILLWGLIMVAGPPTNAEYYMMLTGVMPYAAWGTIAVVVGFVRLIALAINGYWRPTAHLRAIGGVLGTVVWGTLAVSFLLGPNLPTTIAAIVTLLFLDLSAVWYAAGDAKTADNIAQKIRLERNGNVITA